MSDFLGVRELAQLERHSARVLDKRRTDQLVDERIAQAAHMAIFAVKEGVEQYVIDNRSVLDMHERMVARAYIAGVLNLIGKPDHNMGHIASERVVLAQNTVFGGVEYEEVSASFKNVAVVDPDEKPTGEKVSPPDVVEGQAVIWVRETEQNRPEMVGITGTWVAPRDIPEHYLGIDSYTTPDKLTGIASNMLRAMDQPQLNPAFHNVQLLSRFGVDLADSVRDLSVPIEEIEDRIVLPNWIPAPKTTA